MPRQLPTTRYTLSGDASAPGGLTIRIPARRPRLAALFLPAWICVWLVGEIGSVYALCHQSPQAGLAPIIFFSFWCLVWTCGGLQAVYTFAWVVAGREVITLGPDSLSLRREIAGLGFTRCFSLAGIRRLHVAALKDDYPPHVRAGMDSFGLSGAIAFEHDGRARRFGLGLDEEEAYAIVTPIAARL